MSTVTRLTQFAKVAALSALGGSLYLSRDELKPYFRFGKIPQGSTKTEPAITIQEPRLVDNLPEHVPFLIVGGGAASHSAMRAIRGNDAKAKVLIIGDENFTSYMRPALSKDLWISDKNQRRDLKFSWSKDKERSIFYEIDDFYLPLDKMINRETGGVSFIKNLRLTRLDPDNKTAYLESGQTIKYDKCLLAPGGKPRTLPQIVGASDDVKKRVLYFRTAEDFLRLDKISETAKRIAIIGGGFLGTELTFALKYRPTDDNVEAKDQIIYQIFPESGNLGRVLPQYLSEYISEKVKDAGTHLIPNNDIESIKMNQDNSLNIKLSNGESICVDYVVCVVGSEPDVELALSSGLEVDEKTGGYLVNSELEARTDIWVAGDASCFYDMKLGRRRVEHHDHAIQSGRQAGQNMLGAGKAYTHQSMFWSDIGTDISFEAVGLIDSSLSTVAVFAKPGETKSDAPDAENQISLNEENVTYEPMRLNRQLEEKYGKGVIFYLKNDIVVGILLWNLFSRLNLARRILNEQKKYSDFNELAKLFNLYLDD